MTATRVTPDMLLRAARAIEDVLANRVTDEPSLSDCAEAAARALEAAFSLARETASEHSGGDDITLPNNPKPNPGGGG